MHESFCKLLICTNFLQSYKYYLISVLHIRHDKTLKRKLFHIDPIGSHKAPPALQTPRSPQLLPEVLTSATQSISDHSAEDISMLAEVGVRFGDSESEFLSD